MSTDSPLKKAMPWLSKLEEFPFKEKEKGGSGKSNIISTVVDMTMDKEDGGMNENDIPAHTMLKILKEKVKQIQDERTIARKNKNVTEAKSKTDIIEKYMKIITEIEDEQPAVVSLAFTADIVGFPTLWNKILPEPNIDISVLGKPTHDQNVGFQDENESASSENLILTDAGSSGTGRPTQDKSDEHSKRGISKSPKKRNWCKYCKSLQSKISRHLTTMHKDIPEVSQYLQITDTNLKIQSSKRREACKAIINLSNKEYNENVLNNPVFEPIPVKKSKSIITALTHVVCSTCGALVLKKNILSHIGSCKKRQLLIKMPSESLESSYMFKKQVDEKYKILYDKVITYMNKDPIRLEVESDSLILEFGRRFLKGHMEDKQRNYVACKMRTMADLLIRVRKLSEITTQSAIVGLTDCINPTNFDIVCQVVRQWSLYDENNGICKKGSVPRRLCKSLKLCSQILWSQAIKDHSLSLEQQKEIRTKHDRFMALMESDWAIEVNSTGDSSLKITKMSGEDKMPEPEDVATFCSDMDKIIQNCSENLARYKTQDGYESLTKAIIAYLIAFNCKRPSEITYATVENYKARKFSSSLLEKDNLAVFTVAATKNDTRVPVIVTPTVQKAIDVLIENRSFLEVPGRLLFAKMDGKAYDGGNLIAGFKSKMKLKKPSHLTANGFRHFWATHSQCNDELKKHMPKFLGHTIATHQKFYELPLSDIHLNIIGPSLVRHCLPETKTLKHSKVTLPEEEGQTVNEEVREESQIEMAVDEVPEKCQSETIDDHNFDIKSNNVQPNKKRLAYSLQSKSKKRTLRPKKPQSTKVYNYTEEPENEMSFDDTSDDPDFDFESNNLTPKKLFKFHKQTHKRESASDSSDDSLTSPINIRKKNKWTTPEKIELFNGLPLTALGVQQPGRGKVKEVWETSKFIRQNHSLQTTRIEISKYYRKEKKVPTPVKNKLKSSLGKNSVN